MGRACAMGKEQLTLELYEPEHKSESMLRCACDGGSKLLFDFVFPLVKKDPIQFRELSYHACKGGNLEIIDFLENEKMLNYNGGLDGAICAKNAELIERMLNSGANDFIMAYTIACRSGSMESFQYFMTKVPDPYIGFYYACIGGQMEILKQIEPVNVNKGLMGACMAGRMEVIEYLYPKATNLLEVIKVAITHGFLSTVRILAPKCISEELFFFACHYNNRSVVFVCSPVYDINRGIKIAAAKNNDFVVAYLKRNYK